MEGDGFFVRGMGSFRRWDLFKGMGSFTWRDGIRVGICYGLVRSRDRTGREWMGFWWDGMGGVDEKVFFSMAYVMQLVVGSWLAGLVGYYGVRCNFGEFSAISRFHT